MSLKTIAAESNSAAHQQDAGRASIYEYCSINFERILLCDASGISC